MEDKKLLSEKEIIIAKELLKVFKEQEQNKMVTITYYELLERIEGNNYLLDKPFYIKELGNHLGNISRFCHDVLNLPYISGIVVSERDRKPKEGFNLMLEGYGIKEEEKIKEEYKKAQRHKDWSKLENYLSAY